MNYDFQVLYRWMLEERLSIWLQDEHIMASWVLAYGDGTTEDLTGEIAIKWPGMRPMLLRGIVRNGKQ